MAFNMNGSPLNKLNLFRKGRGADYRQVKREIKSNLRKTGGFEATKEGDGTYTVSGGSGEMSQTGSQRRKLARGLAEQMTSGIDGKAFGDGAESVSYSGTMNDPKSKEVTKRSVVELGNGQRAVTGRGFKKSQGGGYGLGTATKDGVTSETSETINIVGVDKADVAAQRAEIQKNNPKTADSDLPPVSMRSSAFKMKASPFNNNSWGSPLNWNSPLNQDGCGAGKIKRDSDGACIDKVEGSEKVTEKREDVGDGDVKITTNTTTQGEQGEKKETDAVRKNKCTSANRKEALAKCGEGDSGKTMTSSNPDCSYPCAKAKNQKELDETKSKDVKCPEGSKKVGTKCVKDTKLTGEQTQEEKRVEGSATKITSVTECPNNGEGYKLENGKCIKKAGVSVKGDVKEKVGETKIKGKDKTCNKSASDCNDKQTFDAENCKCVRDSSKVDKIKDDKKKVKTADKQERNRVKGKCAPCDCP
tara:strand:+ start:321 stop:1742 length:1422 start_codon:yes stop_codon:yes gene_type:complete